MKNYKNGQGAVDNMFYIFDDLATFLQLSETGICPQMVAASKSSYSTNVG